MNRWSPKCTQNIFIKINKTQTYNIIPNPDQIHTKRCLFYHLQNKNQNYMIIDNKHTNFHYLQCQLAFPFNVAHLMRYFMLMTFEQLHFIECLSFWLKPYKTHYYLFSCLKIHEEKKRNNTAHSLTSISTKEKKWNKTKSMHSLCTVHT